MGWLSSRRGAGPDGTTRPWQTFFDNLAPVIESELARGNEVLHHGEWTRISNAYGRGETEYRLDLRYPLDTAAVEAEFELPPEIHLREGSLIRDGASNAVITGKSTSDERREAAVRAWWQRWRAGSQTRVTLAPVSSGVAVVPGPASGHADHGSERP